MIYCVKKDIKVLQVPVHGNIAWEPIFINPQILPIELKKLANEKYLKYLENIPLKQVADRRLQAHKRIHRFINQNMKFMNAKDNSKHFEQFLRFTQTLDKSRGTNVLDIIPEFKSYV